MSMIDLASWLGSRGVWALLLTSNKYALLTVNIPAYRLATIKLTHHRPDVSGQPVPQQLCRGDDQNGIAGAVERALVETIVQPPSCPDARGHGRRAECHQHPQALRGCGEHKP